MACRASDDIEGELGHQLHACMGSAMSQCWGGSVQSADQKRCSKAASGDTQTAWLTDLTHASHMGSDQSSQSSQGPVRRTGQYATAHGASLEEGRPVRLHALHTGQSCCLAEACRLLVLLLLTLLLLRCLVLILFIFFTPVGCLQVVCTNRWTRVNALAASMGALGLTHLTILDWMSPRRNIGLSGLKAGRTPCWNRIPQRWQLRCMPELGEWTSALA